jgi:hypothetical protein
MRVRTNAGCAFRYGKHRLTFFIFQKWYKKASKTHINMHRNIALFAVAGNLGYGINGSIWIVWA